VVFSSSPDKTPDPGGCDKRNGRGVFPPLRASQTREQLAFANGLPEGSAGKSSSKQSTVHTAVSNQMIMLHAEMWGIPTHALNGCMPRWLTRLEAN